MDEIKKDTTNDEQDDLSEDAVVIGGRGEKARKCVSASSFTIKLEVMPEVRQLTEKLTGISEQPEKKPPEKTTGISEQPEKKPPENPTGTAEQPEKKSPENPTGTAEPSEKKPPENPTGTAEPSEKKTTEQPKKSTSDQSAQQSGVSSIRVSKRSDAADQDRKPRITKKAVIIAVTTLFVLLAGIGIYEFVKLSSIVDSVNYVPGGLSFEKVDVLVSESDLGEFVSHTDETKNILLCGCDIDENGISRSDSMIILSIDHTHQKIKMTSLMRDMYVQIPRYGKNKLNASFTFGGGDLLLKTIYANFGMKIDKYACVDYAVFASVVDDLGGVDIDIEEMELEQFNRYVRGGKKNRIAEAGRHHLNGQQALSYCRIRKVGSDTARTARQRRVLNEILKKCRGLSPLHAQKLLGVVAPFITTNMTRDEMTSLLMEGLQCLQYDTMGLRIPMDGAWKDKKKNGIWYVDVDLNKNARYLHQFIYGDNETAQALADRQNKSDDQKDEYARNKYERNKKKKKQ